MYINYVCIFIQVFMYINYVCIFIQVSMWMHVMLMVRLPCSWPWIKVTLKSLEPCLRQVRMSICCSNNIITFVHAYAMVQW